MARGAAAIVRGPNKRLPWPTCLVLRRLDLGRTGPRRGRKGMDRVGFDPIDTMGWSDSVRTTLCWALFRVPWGPLGPSLG